MIAGAEAGAAFGVAGGPVGVLVGAIVGGVIGATAGGYLESLLDKTVKSLFTLKSANQLPNSVVDYADFRHHVLQDYVDHSGVSNGIDIQLAVLDQYYGKYLATE